MSLKHHCMLCTSQLSCVQVANSFGTSVGSKALTMRQAMAIAAVCEVAGAVSLGRGVEVFDMSSAPPGRCQQWLAPSLSRPQQRSSPSDL